MADLPRVLDSQALPASRPGSLLQVTDDASGVALWLSRYEDSPTTWENYRKEAERILLWTRSINKTFAELVYEDVLAFRRFLANPGPDWISRNEDGMPAKFPRGDARWRPFFGPLQPASIALCMRTVGNLFGWLANARYLSGNPFALGRRQARGSKPRLTRNLQPADVALILRSIAALPAESPRERAHRARSRWIFVLLYLTGLRISEVANLKMGDIFSSRGTDGKTRWWARFVGKGGREMEQPVTYELLTELQTYRESMGLSPLPALNEMRPAILRIGAHPKRPGKTPTKIDEDPMTRAAVHAIIKTIVRNVADTLRAQHDPERADQFEKTSAHWMRHAMGSNLGASGASMQVIRDLLHHASVNTTNLYVHTEEESLHDQLERTHKLPDVDDQA